MEDEEEVLGDKSEARDDATSTASCPVGKVRTKKAKEFEMSINRIV